MSVKELNIYPTANTHLLVKYASITERFAIRAMDDLDDAKLILDRNQAHLLMLFLQEHLK